MSSRLRSAGSRHTGNGVYRSKKPEVIAACAPGATYVDITYRNGSPDFSPFRKSLGGVLGDVSITLDIDAAVGQSTRRTRDIAAANEEFLRRLNAQGANPATGQAWTLQQVEDFISTNNLVWHHHESIGQMQLVPYSLNRWLSHIGRRGLLDRELNLPLYAP